MARLQQRTTKPKPPDIQSIRKTQADKALKIAKTIDEKAFIGILNDTYYYIIVRENDKADEIIDLLKEHEIQIKKTEHSWMSNDTALYLKDDEIKEDDTN